MEDDDDPILESLIVQACDIFDFSIYEVMDIDDHSSAIMVLVERFGPLSMDLIERYFEILQKIREHITN